MFLDPADRLIFSKIVEYLNYIHMSTFTYIPSYFIGFILGHYLASGYRLPANNVREHIMWAVIPQLAFIAVNGVNGLYNSLRIIPHSWAWFMINFNRTLHTLGVALMLFHFSSLNSILGYKLASYDDNERAKSNVHEKEKKEKS